MKGDATTEEWLNSEIEKVEKTYLIKATNMTGPYPPGTTRGTIDISQIPCPLR
jgi:hypothetical protein